MCSVFSGEKKNLEYVGEEGTRIISPGFFLMPYVIFSKFVFVSPGSSYIQPACFSFGERVISHALTALWFCFAIITNAPLFIGTARR